MSNSNGLPEWTDRVAFSERDGIAYHPTEVLVHRSGREAADALLGDNRETAGSFLRYREVPDPLRAVHELRLQGVFAQPNHVLFSHSGCSCCDPHPWLLFADPFHADPFHANPFHANPFHTNPFHTNPFHANPFHANPFHTNPFHANYAPNRVALYTSRAPEAEDFRATGVRSNSARPAPRPPNAPDQGVATADRTEPSIVIVDTGLAVDTLRPQALTGVSVNTGPQDDEGPDEAPIDQILDSDAGHGTFIAGVIEGIAPGCKLKVDGLLTGQGDANEADVASRLESLANQTESPDLVNLSFGGSSVFGMEVLAEAVRKLQDAGTVVVASAGNDATCAPTYPAALPDVIAVGALAPDGPAFFTNYGPWVRACAPGVDIVSTFFTEYPTGPGVVEKGEWMYWSGTSFAAPVVVGVLAEQMRLGVSGEEAVRRTIDAPALLRIAGLGTVVNREPWY